MKIENQIKARFFALYLDQQVFLTDNYKNPVTLCAVHLAGISGYIQLRDVADLTDEECENVGILHHWHKGDPYNTKKVLQAMSDNNLGLLYEIADYLRSISILLPFTYLDENNQPVTLSTEEILKLGWAKTGKEISK